MSKRILMDRKEAARLIGCSPQTIAALARAGILVPIKTPVGVRYDALEAVAVWRRGKPWQGVWRAKP